MFKKFLLISLALLTLTFFMVGCGDKQSEETIPETQAPSVDTLPETAPPCIHEFEPATCLDAETCKLCGLVNGDVVAHKFTDYLDDNNATCEKNGTKSSVCDYACGTKDTIEIPDTKLGHSYEETIEDPTCDEDGAKVFTCKRCHHQYEEPISAVGHNFEQWTVIKESTTQYEGSKQSTCTRCGYVVTQSIPIKTIPNGKGISLNRPLSKDDMIAPKEEDFGEYYEHAIKLYNAILNDEAMCYLFFSDEPFNENSYQVERDKYKTFEDIFEKNVLRGKVSIVIDSFVTGAFEEGSGLLRVDIAASKILKQGEMFYNANVQAGLYDGMSEKDAVTKINNWIIGHVQYSIGYTTAEEAYSLGLAQCCGYAKLFKYMCENANMQCQYVVGCTSSSDISTSSCPACHAWNRVKIGGESYYIDVCWNDTSNNKYFLTDILWRGRSVSYVDVLW